MMERGSVTEADVLHLCRRMRRKAAYAADANSDCAMMSLVTYLGDQSPKIHILREIYQRVVPIRVVCPT